jgi:hypothetical protein
VEPKVRQKLNYAKKHWPAALEKYEQQENILGEGRSSYSKTDVDATFMRTKEDHMRNGQLKPAYNVQISTNNQFIASYSLHQSTTDTGTLRPHITELIKGLKVKPSSLTADAGYGSEENYGWLETKRITAYVSITTSTATSTRPYGDKKPFATDKLTYDAEKDRYYCPSGRAMKNIGVRERTTTTDLGKPLQNTARPMRRLPLAISVQPGQQRQDHRGQSQPEPVKAAGGQTAKNKQGD